MSTHSAPEFPGDRRCANCRYYETATSFCRRHPPQVVRWPARPVPGFGKVPAGVTREFPQVLSGDWCGEWHTRVGNVPPVFEWLRQHAPDREHKVGFDEIAMHYVQPGQGAEWLLELLRILEASGHVKSWARSNAPTLYWCTATK